MVKSNTSHALVKRLEISAREQNKIIQQLVDELRQQLSLIFSTYQELNNNQEVSLPPSLQELIQSSNIQTQKLYAILNLTKDITQFRREDNILNTRPCHYATLIQKAIKSLAGLTREKGIDIELRTDNTDLEIFLDELKMITGLTTLLRLFIELSESDETISVRISVDSNTNKKQDIKQAQVTIQANRLDLPNNINQILFDFFHTIRINGRESGLGLALPRYVARLHGGDLTFATMGKKSATAKLTIPIGTQHLSPGEIDYLSEPSVAPGRVEIPMTKERLNIGSPDEMSVKKPTIIAVDDEPEIHTMLKAILKSEYNIITCDNGHKALRLIKENKPDLIISDIMMPLMDGITLVKKLKNSDDFSGIPVVLLTAVADERSRVEGLRTQADAYLTKPFNVEELRVVIKNLIHKHHLLIFKYAAKLESQLPNQVHLAGQDKIFLEKIHETVITNITNYDFSPDDLARTVHLSRRQLERKLKALTNISPNKFISEMRLLTAHELIEKKATSSVAETATVTGFNNPAYFTKLFSQRFGIAPSSLINRNREITVEQHEQSI